MGAETENRLPLWGKPGRPPASAAGTYSTAPGTPKTGRYANRAGKYAPLKDNPARAAARALYEATPGATCTSVSLETKIPEGTLRRWKSEDGWKPAARNIPNLAGRAGALANTFKVKMAELGKPLSDDVAAAEAAREVSTDHAVGIRAAVLDRHRKEWAAPRKLAYESVTKRDFELAKLAKITAETLQIVQVGECRAFGLDHASRGNDGGTVVLIERGGAAPADEIPVPGIEGGTGVVTPDGNIEDGDTF